MELARLTAELAILSRTRQPSETAAFQTGQQIANDAYLLMQYASRISRWDEAHCNGTISAQQMRMHGNAVDRVMDILKRYRLTADHNSDPRGYSIYIHFPTGIYNTLGGRETGWGI